MDSTALILLASGLLLFAAGYIARALRVPQNHRALTRVDNPLPYPSADPDYWVVEDAAGNLALTIEQVIAARDRATRLGL